MKHLIIIRLNYVDDLKFEKRMIIMDKTCVKSLTSQKNKNFIIGIICKNEKHFDIVSDKFKGIEVCRIDEKLIDFCKRNNYQIQTRLDSDDIINDDYIDIIQNISKECSKPILIQTQPYKYCIDLNKTYKMAYRYNDKITSMFLTLVQEDIKYTVMDRKHNEMSQIVSNVISTKEGICKLVIHGDNTITGVSKYDILI
jgi:hypothetical protein